MYHCIIMSTVDGGWSDWQGWSKCSVTCGWGSQKRKRDCDYPEPYCYGADCVGDNKEDRECDAGCCPGKL